MEGKIYSASDLGKKSTDGEATALEKKWQAQGAQKNEGGGVKSALEIGLEGGPQKKRNEQYKTRMQEEEIGLKVAEAKIDEKDIEGIKALEPTLGKLPESIKQKEEKIKAEVGGEEDKYMKDYFEAMKKPQVQNESVVEEIPAKYGRRTEEENRRAVGQTNKELKAYSEAQEKEISKKEAIEKSDGEKKDDSINENAIFDKAKKEISEMGFDLGGVANTDLLLFRQRINKSGDEIEADLLKDADIMDSVIEDSRLRLSKLREDARANLKAEDDPKFKNTIDELDRQIGQLVRIYWKMREKLTNTKEGNSQEVKTTPESTEKDSKDELKTKEQIQSEALTDFRNELKGIKKSEQWQGDSIMQGMEDFANSFKEKTPMAESLKDMFSFIKKKGAEINAGKLTAKKAIGEFSKKSAKWAEKIFGGAGVGKSKEASRIDRMMAGDMRSDEAVGVDEAMGRAREAGEAEKMADFESKIGLVTSFHDMLDLMGKVKGFQGSAEFYSSEDQINNVKKFFETNDSKFLKTITRANGLRKNVKRVYDLVRNQQGEFMKKAA
jgi:hypothetical protein